jgi:hypothetical protein
MLLAFGFLLTLIGLFCSALVLVHAFRRSVGTGVMVLCVPVYNVYYAFSQFEHRRKGAVLFGYLGCLVLGCFLQAVALRPA